jgi:GT2 family glycosyltransferase
VLKAVGGFNPARFSGGDAEFCRAAGQRGHAIRLVPGAVVHHPARATWEALATKARRVKGGQIMNGSPRSRAVWLLRTLTPPLRALSRFARTDRPWRERLAAIRVLFALWGVELLETARVLTGGARERR